MYKREISIIRKMLVLAWDLNDYGYPYTPTGSKVHPLDRTGPGGDEKRGDALISYIEELYEYLKKEKDKDAAAQYKL